MVEEEVEVEVVGILVFAVVAVVEEGQMTIGETILTQTAMIGIIIQMLPRVIAGTVIEVEEVAMIGTPIQIIITEIVGTMIILTNGTTLIMVVITSGIQIMLIMAEVTNGIIMVVITSGMQIIQIIVVTNGIVIPQIRGNRKEQIIDGIIMVIDLQAMIGILEIQLEINGTQTIKLLAAINGAMTINPITTIGIIRTIGQMQIIIITLNGPLIQPNQALINGLMVL